MDEVKCSRFASYVKKEKRISTSIVGLLSEKKDIFINILIIINLKIN